MALPRTLFAPAFRHQHLRWFFGALVGIMVFVATFATAAEGTLSVLTLSWHIEAQNRITIEIPSTGDETAQSQNDRVQQVLALIHPMAGVASVQPVSDDEAQQLLKPWINQPEVLKILSLPVLIDVERDRSSPVTTAAISDKLKSLGDDIRVDDHAAWLADMKHLVHGLCILAGIIIVLSGMTLGIAVTLVCRAIIATEHETLALLHMIGAEDDVIARTFQSHSIDAAWRAACTGFGMALVSAGGLLIFFRHFADIDHVQPAHWVGIAVFLCTVPLTAIILTAASARLSVLRILKAMP